MMCRELHVALERRWSDSPTGATTGPCADGSLPTGTAGTNSHHGADMADDGQATEGAGGEPKQALVLSRRGGSAAPAYSHSIVPGGFDVMS